MSDKRKIPSICNDKLHNSGKKFKKNNSMINIEIDKCIGSGSFAKVYTLKNDLSKCIKIYHEFQDSGEFEIECLTRFNCNNIIKFYNKICIKDEIGLVLEYCEINLWNFLKNIECNNNNIISTFLKDISNALSYLKCKEIIHLDIKPENILIKNDTYFKLCDFNSACKINNKVYTFYIVSVWYRPPEIILENINYDYSVDIWSFGCVLYELINYFVLFYCEQTNDVFDRKIIIKKQIELFGLKDCSEKFINGCNINNDTKTIYYDSDIVPANINSFTDTFMKSKYKDLCLKMLTIDFYKRITIEEIVEELKLLE